MHNGAVSTPADTPGDFAMIVVEATGPLGAEVIGQPVLGRTPGPGTLVWLVRRGERALRARVTGSEDLPDGRARLVLEGWGSEPLWPRLGIATDPALLDPWPPPPPELAADRYLDYAGPPIPYEWGEWGLGVDADILVQLGRQPGLEERASLERLLVAWGDDGAEDGYGPGYLHGFYDDPDFGLRWSGPSLRWKMDFGSADAEQAADELARRLAGWSVATGVPVVRLRFGEDEQTA